MESSGTLPKGLIPYGFNELARFLSAKRQGKLLPSIAHMEIKSTPEYEVICN